MDGCRARLYQSRDYWFGLYKLTATPNGTTAWYDSNPSTFRDWYTDENNRKYDEPNERTVCIRYTRAGFKDRSCSYEYYYTCKKAAGNFCAVATCLDNVFFTLFTSRSNNATNPDRSIPAQVRNFIFPMWVRGKKFFSQRVVAHWNKLPESDVMAVTLNTSKNRLDRCNEWDI